MKLNSPSMSTYRAACNNFLSWAHLELGLTFSRGSPNAGTKTGTNDLVPALGSPGESLSEPRNDMGLVS